VAIVARRYERPLRAGVKSIEARLSRQRRCPFGRIGAGDRVFFKLSGGEIIGVCRVRAVRLFSDLTPGDVAALRARYGASICAPNSYWEHRAGCRFATLVHIGPLRRARHAPTLPRQFGNAWVPLARPG
jgi:hypothetical protein